MVISGVESSSSSSASVNVEASTLVTTIAAIGALLLMVVLFINRRYFFGTSTQPHRQHESSPTCDEVIHTSAIRGPASRPRGIERAFSFEASDSLEDLDDPLLYSQPRPSSAPFVYNDIERGDPSSSFLGGSSKASSLQHHHYQPSRSESRCTHTSIESGPLKETKIDAIEPNQQQLQQLQLLQQQRQQQQQQQLQAMTLEQHSARMAAYRQLALAQSSVESDATNNQDSIVALSQEVLSPGSCGSIEVAFLYDAPMRKMTVHVLQARDLPLKDRGQPGHSQIRLIMLPHKKQKHKTKIRTGENPQFMESFLLHRVNPEEVNSMAVRFRVYGCERMRRQRLIGETTVQFSSLKLELENSLWLVLQPRANIQMSGSACDLASLGRSDSVSSCSSMQHGGVAEMLLGLAYNGTTGSLAVEVIKGSHFRKLSINKAPDTYVKLCVVSSLGQEMGRTKTTTRRGQPNPLYKEIFLFQVALFQLSEVTLMVSVWWRRSVKKNEMVGWFSLGLNSSGPEEAIHWRDMREARGEQVQRWHVLIDS